MFEIWRDDDGTVKLKGRLDATWVDAARDVLDGVEDACPVDCAELDYIASAGLGVLIGAQKRLTAGGGDGLRLRNLNPHLRELFEIAGLTHVFELE